MLVKIDVFFQVVLNNELVPALSSFNNELNTKLNEHLPSCGRPTTATDEIVAVGPIDTRYMI